MTERNRGPNRADYNLARAIPWKNVASEDVPAFGVVQLRANYTSGSSQADKPNDTVGLFFVNGPVPIVPTKHGESFVWDRPRQVLIDGDPTVGDEVGPVSGEWYMSTSGTGWRVLHQAVDGVGVVVQIGGGGASLDVSWGHLDEDSGKDDSFQSITLYDYASEAEFDSDTCGCDTGSGSGGSGGSGSGSGSGSTGCTFLDMTLDLCNTSGSGSGSGSGGQTVRALVPAGYKAGPVGLIKMPVGDCGSGSGSGSGSGPEWVGWTVIVGRRQRCMLKIPTKVECCTNGGLKFTEFDRIWYFGDEIDTITDPCPTGSGS